MDLLNQSETKVKFQFVADAGADVNSQDAEGVTALHIAALNEHVDCVKMLLEHEADVTARSTEGWTPLHTVAQSGHLDCIKLLLLHGADPNERTLGEGWTPLDIAAETCHTQCVSLLLQRGAKASIFRIKYLNFEKPNYRYAYFRLSVAVGVTFLDLLSI